MKLLDEEIDSGGNERLKFFKRKSSRGVRSCISNIHPSSSVISIYDKTRDLSTSVVDQKLGPTSEELVLLNNSFL